MTRWAGVLDHSWRFLNSTCPFADWALASAAHTILVAVNFFSSSGYPPATTDLERMSTTCGCLHEYVTQTDTGWRKELQRHPDHERLASTADRHGVVAATARALSLAGIPCETWRARARQIVFRNLALAAELVRLVALARAWIEVLAL